jgi:hypothetical protein
LNTQAQQATTNSASVESRIHIQPREVGSIQAHKTDDVRPYARHEFAGTLEIRGIVPVSSQRDETARVAGTFQFVTSRAVMDGTDGRPILILVRSNDKTRTALCACGFVQVRPCSFRFYPFGFNTIFTHSSISFQS